MDSSKKLHTVLSLCTGYGGIERGLDLAGFEHRVVAHVEIEAFAAANLVAKMEAGQLVPAPIWTDLKTLPAHCFRERIDLLTGGYPCQPFSAAGQRKGAEDPRHLWPHIRQHIETIRPIRCFFENVEGHISLGLREVIEDLESLGYATTWGVFSAAEVGAPHQRKRVFILAVADGVGLEKHGYSQSNNVGQPSEDVANATSAGSSSGKRANFQKDAKEKAAEIQRKPQRFSADVANAHGAGQQPSEGQPRSPETRDDAWRGGAAMADADRQRQPGWSQTNGRQTGAGSEGFAATDLADAISQGLQGRLPRGQDQERQDQQRHSGRGSAALGQPEAISWATEPDVGRVVNGAAFRVDRLRLLGNGVVPQTAAKAWITLHQQLTDQGPKL